MSKYNVQAVKRPGFQTVSRGGRAWPSSQPTVVEVLDQDECPTTEAVDSNGVKRQVPDPNRIGRKAWEAVLADGRLSKWPAGLTEGQGDAAEVTVLRARVAELEQQLAAALPKLSIESTPAPETSDVSSESLVDTDKGDAPPKGRGRTK